MAVHPTAAEEFVLMREPSRVLRPGLPATPQVVRGRELEVVALELEP